MDWLFLSLWAAALSIAIVPLLWEGSNGLSRSLSLVATDNTASTQEGDGEDENGVRVLGVD